MTKFVVVLALVLAVVSGNKQHKYENTKSILAEINRDALGNSLLSMIQLATATGTPTDQVNLLLQNLASTLNNQQASADRVNENDEATCEKLVADMEQEIQYHQTQITATTKLREDTVEALEEAEKEVRQATKDIEQNENSFASEQALRQQQHETWERKDAEHVDQIESIDEASKIVQHLQAGVAFSQIKSRFEKIQAKLAEGKHALFKPLIGALTQLASKVDNKAIIKILDLLSQVRQQLVQSRNSLQNTEDRQVENWAAQSVHLQEEHKRLVERKQYLEGAIVSYKETISAAIQTLEDHTLGLEDETEALRIQTVWCENQAQSYEEQTNERSRQVDIIERIQEALTSKAGAAAEFIQEREDVF